jgi:SAM-dependent methyltransferase
MEPYSALSGLYDRLNYDCDCDEWARYLTGLLSAYGADTGGEGLDAACGTGRLTLALLRRGLTLFGIDASEGMLREARRNLSCGKRRAELIRADMLTFRPLKKLPYILCSCDGVNYIPPDALPRLFKNFYTALKPGGVLLFDVSSQSKLQGMIEKRVFYEDTEYATYLWVNSAAEDGRAVRMEITFFIKNGSNYLRFDENHIQYMHMPEAVCDCLRGAGFSRAESFGFLTENAPAEKDARIQFAARK